MFTDKIKLMISSGVATIGGKYLITKGVGTVIWSCADDEGRLYKNKFNNVLYFSDSLVSILSATALD